VPTDFFKVQTGNGEYFFKLAPCFVCSADKPISTTTMKTVALIPARYGATRFPAKLLADLCGKPLIVRTYLSTVATGVFDEVMVVTDHRDIAELIEAEGGSVFFSQRAHESGSDRIAEAVLDLKTDVVVNVQGD